MKPSESSDQPAEKQAPSFDQALSELQHVVRTLEGGELSLEDSLKAFEKGVALSRVCQQQLLSADQKIDLLLRGGDGSSEPELTSFRAAHSTTVAADEGRKTKT